MFFLRKLSKVIDILLYMIVGVVITAAITSALWDAPVLLSAVRSNSMSPLFKRGDMLLIQRITEKDSIEINDIVIFKSTEGHYAESGYIVHRIIGGNQNDGYITKGDANDFSDQDLGEMPLLKKEWIYNKVLVFHNRPLKIPLIGYLPLRFEHIHTNLYIIPMITIILAFVLGFSEFFSNKKRKKKKKSGFELHLIYFFSGLTIIIIIATSMLTISQRLKFPYEVSNTPGVLLESRIGILTLGDEIQIPLSEISNKGFFPIIATITSDDDQITFSHDLLLLNPKNSVKTEMHVKASKIGIYNSTIHVSIFYPFLPKGIIQRLALKSYFMTVLIVSLVPGLPLMLYPILNKQMRKKMTKKNRQFYRRLRGSFHI